MHIDNLEALNTIKSILNVGSVTIDKDRNYCSFVVQDFSDIRDVICPIFEKFPLLTSKRLDFQDFHKAVLIKNKNNLSNTDKERIILLKNGMNSKREIFTSYSINSQINVNPDWFIGFLEGEGTFGIKTGSSIYFQLAQKITSVESLNAIITFLTSLKSNALFGKNSKILPLNVVSTINNKTNVMSLVTSSVDALYYYILPLLDTSKMYTFKFMDFKL
jgi:LAGLIDADG endonuclease